MPFTFNDPKISWSWNWEKKAWSVRDGDKVLASIDKNGSTLSIIYENFDGNTLDANKITGKSGWDSVYYGNMPKGYVPAGTTEGSIKVTDVKLVTVGGANDGKVEYYDVDTAFKFTKKSGATNPNDAVPSSLVITYTDMYGHKNVTKLPAEVLHR